MPAHHFNGDPDQTTLREARNWTAAKANEGARCPCCTRFVKIYKRKITSSMAYALIILYRHDQQQPGAWVELSTFFAGLPRLDPKVAIAVRSNSTALGLWKLIEENPDDGSQYRITDLGHRFVAEDETIPKYVYIYDDRRLSRVSPEQVTIREALADKFDYEELMAPASV